MWVQSLVWGDPLEEGMTTHSSILAWKIPWTEEPKELDMTEATWHICTGEVKHLYTNYIADLVHVINCLAIHTLHIVH